jgi:SAM-dependent methyltransferase
MTDRSDNPYDVFAQGYADSNENDVWNAHYERPAALALLGDVTGQRVLDAGCGAGAHAAALVERGARVTGIDSSAGLLAIAVQRLAHRADRAEFRRADLRDPLPFDDGSFDVVLASLVLHYLPEWAPTLAEFHRVLRAGGRLVASVHHPFMDHVLAAGEDYFATYDFVDEWCKGGERVSLRFWHRPLSTMTRQLREAGFVLDVVDEPQPVAAARDIDPDAWHVLSTQPRFLFLAASAVVSRDH